MNQALQDKIVENLRKAADHNSQIMVRPEVILWPDPDRQFEAVIPVLQQSLPELLVLGSYQPDKRQGPAIWMKCMIARSLPEALWPETATPILYLPGMTKHDFKNIPVADPYVQPLMEYQYTGTLFTQKNGREWTVLAFMENEQDGMGLRVAQDNVTRDYLIHVLPMIFQDRDMPWPQTIVDASFLQGLLFPDAAGSILKWLCKGDDCLAELPEGKVEAFRSICTARFGFEPDYRNRVDIAQKLGSQRNEWKQVWQHYANAPNKYPELEPLLRLAKPDDLGTGMFAFPEESWPQVNDQKEDELRKAFQSAAKVSSQEALEQLEKLHAKHAVRLQWVWNELGQSPLVRSLSHLLAMTDLVLYSIPASTIQDLTEYYTQQGYLADQAMRKALASVRSDRDKKAVKGLITSIYKPWLEHLAQKFQSLVAQDASIFTAQNAQDETESFVLFVDAFRFELAKEFSDNLKDRGLQVDMEVGWSAIPSLTPTAKPNISPIGTLVSTSSDIKEFRPQLNNGKDLNTANFRAALAENGFEYIPNSSAIDNQKKQWQEIGEIDTKGHAEQSDMVKRINELFDQVTEAIEAAFEKGIKRIKIVTDHGWLLLPGGLPKQDLNKNLTDNRWGRCALIKEGAQVNLLRLPWRWNPLVFIAYAEGIHFFRKNDEYAHGGLSLHECLVPTLLVEHPGTAQTAGRIVVAKWINLTCKVITTDVPDGYRMDIRTVRSCNCRLTISSPSWISCSSVVAQ